MPLDRPAANNARPLKPTLASNRTAKTPITPRLAAAATAAAATTPQASRSVKSSNASTPRINTTVRDDVTPVKAFLSSNITPRSSSRKSRVGVDSLSASSTPCSTPTDTPTSSRPASTIDFPQRELGIGYSGLGFNGSNSAQPGVRPRSVAGPNGSNIGAAARPLSNVYSYAPSEAGSAKDVSSLFFHANDAKPNEQPASQKKAPVFFYANGRQDEAPRRLDGPSPPLSSLGRPSAESKFFHADSIPESRDRTSNPTPPPASFPDVVLRSNSTAGPSLRPASPTKDWTPSSNRNGPSPAIRPALNSRHSGQSNVSNSSTHDVAERPRRISSATAATVRFGHSKSTSLSSIDFVADLKKGPSNEAPRLAPSPLHAETRVVSNGSLAESMASAPSPPLTAFAGIPSPTPGSPIKVASGQSPLEAMNELAANARRERKVLDLEISNSSLLAINRSLEKEVRKQKAELRRFRRMSRAGRFSLDTVSSVPETFAAPGFSLAGDLSDMSEEDEPAPPEDDEAESSDSSMDEGALSPAAQAEWDEAHRLRDEKRLQLDLSKHRELLVDSQKMNQSLKRCLNWTEQLIKDGQKALQYQVHVSDVKLGGRVLVDHDEHDVPPEESRGLLSPWSPLHQAMEALESPFFSDADRVVDRDSGVDVDGLEPGGEEHGDAEMEMVRLGSPFEERIKHLQASIEALEAS